MAITVLTVQNVVRAGLNASYSAANVDGHTVVNDGVRTFVHAKNGSGGAITLTFVTPGTADGLALADRTVVIPAGEERAVGAFPLAYYSNPLTVTFSGVTSLTIGAFKLSV